MTKPAENPFPFAETIGAAVRRAKQERALSDSRLAKLSGVSRRHLAELQKGANVTLSVAQRVMGALGLSELVFGPAQRLAAGDRNQMETAADRLEKSAILVMQAAGTLRSITRGSNGSTENATGLAGKAASLTDEFIAQIAALSPEDKLVALQLLASASDGEPAAKNRRSRSAKRRVRP